MAILKGIKIEGGEEVHQIDYEDAIANKPFETLSSETLFEWDGNVDGLEHWDVTMGGDTGPYFYKINSQTPAKEKLIGAVFTGYIDEETVQAELTEEHIEDGIGATGTEDKCFAVGGLLIVVAKEINIAANDDFPYDINLTPGTWHINPIIIDGMYVKNITKEEIKYINEKYIPKSLKVTDEQKVPDTSNAGAGAFLRVVDGVATWQQLTNVSEVGA